MSVREDILETVGNDLENIKIINGYNNNLNYIYKGFIAPNEVNEFPVCFYFFGDEELSETDETGLNIGKYNLTLFIGLYIQEVSDFKSSGELTNTSEKYISDIRQWINQNSERGNNILKLNEIKEINYWNLTRIEPYLDYQKNITGLFFTIIINYLDVN